MLIHAADCQGIQWVTKAHSCWAPYFLKKTLSTVVFPSLAFSPLPFKWWVLPFSLGFPLLKRKVGLKWKSLCDQGSCNFQTSWQVELKLMWIQGCLYLLDLNSHDLTWSREHIFGFDWDTAAINGTSCCQPRKNEVNKYEREVHSNKLKWKRLFVSLFCLVTCESTNLERPLTSLIYS